MLSTSQPLSLIVGANWIWNISKSLKISPFQLPAYISKTINSIEKNFGLPENPFLTSRCDIEPRMTTSVSSDVKRDKTRLTHPISANHSTSFSPIDQSECRYGCDVMWCLPHAGSCESWQSVAMWPWYWQWQWPGHWQRAAQDRRLAN